MKLDGKQNEHTTFRILCGEIIQAISKNMSKTEFKSYITEQYNKFVSDTNHGYDSSEYKVGTALYKELEAFERRSQAARPEKTGPKR